MSSESLYSYIDAVRADVTVNPLYLEDICMVIVGYHNCYRVSEVVEIGEIVKLAATDTSKIFRGFTFMWFVVS